MVDKQKIAYKKSKYGNNFPDIAEDISNMLKVRLTPEDAAMIMYIMKRSRYKRGSETTCNEKVNHIRCIGLNDTEQDMIDYHWIANNYDEYISLEWNGEKIYD